MNLRGCLDAQTGNVADPQVDGKRKPEEDLEAVQRVRGALLGGEFPVERVEIRPLRTQDVLLLAAAEPVASLRLAQGEVLVPDTVRGRARWRALLHRGAAGRGL